MYCLKCGNETGNEQIFCTHCLEVMESYPVKPGTNIQLPRRNPVPVQKKQSRRRSLSPEEQIVRMRVTIRTLFALLGVSLIALGIAVWLNFLPREASVIPEEPSKGQNYTVDPTLE